MKSLEHSKNATVNRASAVQRVGQPTKTIVDNRPQAIAQRKLQKAVDNKRSSILNNPTVQLKTKEFRSVGVSKELIEMVQALDKCVTKAKAIVDNDPKLTNYSNTANGYLKAWVTEFTEFVNSGSITSFFYARYGYAIEALATMFFLQESKGKTYTVHAQISHGTTRPDIVIRDKKGDDCAWLDITSSRSAGHINDKQGGKWKSCPYVGEILYDMPMPTDFKNAKGLSKEQIDNLQKADIAAAENAANAALAIERIVEELGDVYTEAAQEVGGDWNAVAKSKVKEITMAVLKEYVPDLKPAQAINILSAILEIDVNGDLRTGMQIAKKGFPPSRAKKPRPRSGVMGKDMLAELGRALAEKEKEDEELDEKESKKRKRSNSSMEPSQKKAKTESDEKVSKKRKRSSSIVKSPKKKVKKEV